VTADAVLTAQDVAAIVNTINAAIKSCILWIGALWDIVSFNRTSVFFEKLVELNTHSHAICSKQAIGCPLHCLLNSRIKSIRTCENTEKVHQLSVVLESRSSMHLLYSMYHYCSCWTKILLSHNCKCNVFQEQKMPEHRVCILDRISIMQCFVTACTAEEECWHCFFLRVFTMLL
jgi:hypothetical protein